MATTGNKQASIASVSPKASAERLDSPITSLREEGGLNTKPLNDAEDVTEEKLKTEQVVVKESSIDPENEISGVRLLLIHLSICLCTFLVGLDFNMLATAIPMITTAFGSVQDMGWYGASFMMALCASQPLAGKTYVLFPPKATYIAYLALLEAGSLISALASSSPVLIVGRAVAGLGASGIFAGGFAILTTIVPLHKRAIYTGTMSSSFAIASIAGPVLGGGLTQRLSWRWCFYINLPIGGLAAAFFIPLARIHRPPATQNGAVTNKLKALDCAGFILFSGSIVMLLLGLQWGGLPGYPWQSATIAGLLVGSAVTMSLFVAWQLREGGRGQWQDGGSNSPGLDYALIPPRLFTCHRNVTLLCAGAFFLNGPFQILTYWLPLWFQAVLGNSPTASAVNYFPTVLSDVLAAFVGAAIVQKLGWWNPFLICGPALVSIGAGLLSTIRPEISSGHWIGYQIFSGIGYALGTNMAHLGMQATLPQHLVSLGASTLLTVISTSCAIFLAVGQAIFQKRLSLNLSFVLPLDAVEKLVYSTGAANLQSNIPDGSDVVAVVNKYSLSITQVMYLTASAPVLSFVLFSGCSWISVKQREKEELTEADKVAGPV